MIDIENARLVCIDVVPAENGLGFIEIPVEAIIDGEVVTIDTKAIPIAQPKEM
jgi:hypothetical protein